MAWPLMFILLALVLGSYFLAKNRSWKVSLFGNLLLWSLLMAITKSLYPRFDYATTFILIGGIGFFVLMNTRHKPLAVKKWTAPQRVHKMDNAPSFGIELASLPYFLTKITHLVESGFTNLDVETIQQRALTLTVDEEAYFEFWVQHQGKRVPLHILIFMDDINEVAVYFATARRLSEKIHQEIELYQQETAQAE